MIEDCSQAHGAKVGGRPVGTFGDIAAFSAMYRKAHIAGGSGGIVYTRDRDLYHQGLAHADRGKPRWRDDFSDYDPNCFLFPALNLHTDEISCGIGLASLKRLQDTIMRRLIFVAELTGRMRDRCKLCQPYGYSPSDSPFIYPVVVDVGPHYVLENSNSPRRFGGGHRPQSALPIPGRGLALAQALSRRWVRYSERSRHPRSILLPLSQRKLWRVGSERLHGGDREGRTSFRSCLRARSVVRSAKRAVYASLPDDKCSGLCG